MTRQQLVALAIGAVVVFWMVGAHNRLISLRNQIRRAWARVDEALRARAAAAEPLLQALRGPLAAEQGALDTLQSALADSARHAATVGARAVAEPAQAAAWVGAESATAASASRVFALLDLHPELRQEPDVTANAAGWRDATARLAFARQLYNEAAATYDEAIDLFPTRLLVPVFGFGRAPRI